MYENLCELEDFGEVILRDDGSFVIDVQGCGFHVPNMVPYAELWKKLRQYADSNPDKVKHEELQAGFSLNDLKTAKAARIDAETSAAIASGFDYAVGGVTYHFSYDTFDQQNFADTANVCLMKQSGMPGLPDSVTWNAYTVPGGELERLTFDASGFLALYAGGAMKHKNETMQRGGERKAAVEAAATPEEVEAA